MNGLVVEKPMHKCSFRWHHIWIFLHTLSGYFFGAQLGTWIPGRIFAETGRVRRGVEFGGFLENEGFGGLFGSIIL